MKKPAVFSPACEPRTPASPGSQPPVPPEGSCAAPLEPEAFHKNRLPCLGRGEILAELSRRRFTDFAPWVHRGLDLAGFHGVYYRVLEAFAEGTIRRLIVSMPPQHGKSLGATVLLPAWLLGRDPARRVAVASYNATLAARFNRQIQRVMSSGKYASAFPASALPAPRRPVPGGSVSAGQIDLPAGGGTFAVGREGTLTGNAVDVAILDDLYKDAMEASSPTVRDNCWEWYTQVVRTRLHNRSQELIVFTRWHEEDLVGRIAASEPVVELTGWAQVEAVADGPPPDPDTWLHLRFEALKESPPTELDPRAPGEALWPARHSARLLASRRRLDPHGFAALYQGRPSSGEGLLYGARFECYDELPREILRRACYIDTADTGEDFLCAVCYAVGRGGLIYVTGVVYSQEPMELTEVLAGEAIKSSGTRTVRVESNNGGRGFARALQRALPGVEVGWFHQSAGKEARILSSAPTLLRTVRMPRDWADRWPAWWAHLTLYRRAFRTNRWHDAADALTGALEWEQASVRPAVRAVRFLK